MSTLDSISGNIELKLLKYPYYTPIFRDVPMNSFSFILFLYLGDISIESYEKYFEIFKQILVTVDPNSSIDYSPHKKFPLNKGIPEKAYLFSLTEGRFQKNVRSDTDLLKEVLSSAQDENEKIYDLLSDFFRISLRIYDSLDDITEENKVKVFYTNSKSTKEVSIFLEEETEKVVPILIQELDGTIRLRSYNL